MEGVYPGPQAGEPAVNLPALEAIGRDLLIAIGSNPDAPGLLETPARFARWWQEFIEYDPGKTDTLFESYGNGADLVAVSGLRVWSLCEHHLLPFWADITIGYLPAGSILGLSKFARIAHQFAHRPQLQERLVADIAAEIRRLTGSPHVGVIARGEHLCMTMRGIRTPGLMVSTSLWGDFTRDPLRSELMDLSRG